MVVHAPLPGRPPPGTTRGRCRSRTRGARSRRASRPRGWPGPARRRRGRRSLSSPPTRSPWSRRPSGPLALGHRYDHICSARRPRGAGRDERHALATYLQHLGFAITADPGAAAPGAAGVGSEEDGIVGGGPPPGALERPPPTPADEIVEGSDL